MTHERPINLVWRRTMLDGVLESQFLRQVVLAGIGRPQRWIAVEDGQALPDMDDLLVCSFGDCGSYLRELRSNGRRNLGVLHLGDEQAADDIAFYAEADYVLRHYHRPSRTPAGRCRAVIWIPNGWARSVGPAEPDLALAFDARSHEFFFAGFAGPEGKRLPDRKAMLDALATLGRPATVILTDGFAKGLGPASYAAYLADSRFALVPAGNAAETIRFYDALELGALPVLIDAPWLHDSDGIAALGPPPVIALNHWRELAGVTDGPYGEQFRQSTAAWWLRFKELTQARVADVIEDAFARSGGGG
jgi:hypothetical protein